MNQKLVVLVGSVAAFHLAVGGLFLAGGCAQEDPPMPPGIYVPKHGNAMNTRQQDPAVSEKPVGPESTLDVQEPKKADTQKQTVVAGTPATPSDPAPAPAPAGKDVKYGDGTEYKVVKGDSLWKLSRKFKVTIEDLATFNGLAANARLYIGQTLMIPAEGQKVKEASPKAKKFVRAKRPAKKKAVAKKAASKGKKAAVRKNNIRRATAALPADGVYTVKSGDNFTVIARRFGLRIADIQSANPNVNSSRLQIGQKLQLPAPGAVAGTAKKTPAANDKEILDSAINNAATGESKSADTKKPAETSDMTKLLDDAVDTNTTAADPSASAAPAQKKGTESVSEGTSVPAAELPSDKNKFIVLDDGTGAVRLGEDMTIAEFCKKYSVNEEQLNTVNPMLPFDGKLKAGLLVKIPEKKLPENK